MPYTSLKSYLFFPSLSSCQALSVSPACSCELPTPDLLVLGVIRGTWQLSPRFPATAKMGNDDDEKRRAGLGAQSDSPTELNIWDGNGYFRAFRYFQLKWIIICNIIFANNYWVWTCTISLILLSYPSRLTYYLTRTWDSDLQQILKNRKTVFYKGPESKLWATVFYKGPIF